MSRLIPFLIGLLVTGAGALSGGIVAFLAVDWYHVSVQEGVAGSFVAAFAMLAPVAAFAIGVVCARIAGVQSGRDILKGIGLSFGSVGVLTAVAVAVVQGLADIPPTIDNQSLFLMVEVRYPADPTKSPADEPGEAFLRLGSTSKSGELRASRRGPLFKEDAQLIDGNWVIPGAVEVFTDRDGRRLEIVLGSQPPESLHLPLRGSPSAADEAWSAWLPRPPSDGQAPANRLSFRYRVRRSSEPRKTEVVGPFEIMTMTRRIYDTMDDGKPGVACDDEYRVHHIGRPLVLAANPKDQVQRITALAVLPGSKPALLVSIDERRSGFVLVRDDGEKVSAELVAYARDSGAIHELDPAPTPPAADSCRSPHRTVISRPGLLLVGDDGVVDTRTLAVHRFSKAADFIVLDAVPPLGLSPDRRSFVRAALAAGPGDAHTLVVTDFVSDRARGVAIDRRRMRYPMIELIDAAWVAHHFSWQKDEEGIDRLVERGDFAILPHRGGMAIDGSGHREYRLEGGTQALRSALVDLLVDTRGGVLQPAKEEASIRRVQIGEREIYVGYNPDFHYVAVGTARGTDPAVVVEIADQFDTALASGTYDSLFEFREAPRQVPPEPK